MWVGHAVLSNTFRHPAVLAKAATVLDHATGGRFILGLGAGWYEGEHDAVRDRPAADRPSGSTASSRPSDVIQALFSAAAAAPPGRDPRRPVLPARGRDQPARRR